MERQAVDSEFVIETQGLTKTYGKTSAVKGLDLNVQRGEVYGFLGPNGAGKTTTLRMLLGLIKPSSGSASVLGRRPGEYEMLRRVGGLVESAAFYPYLSGQANLEVVARLGGVKGVESRVGEVLQKVGLSERAKDKYKKYSTGMKQRLGVGAALLKDPELLILDEPTNGLDPRGMADMRELIREAGSGERTVLLSSHLMGEVEQICDRVGVIRKGELIAEGTVDELRGPGAILVRADPMEEAVRVVEELPEVEEAEVQKNGLLRIPVDPEKSSQISHKLASAGIRVGEIRPEQRSLEEVFFELTEERTEEEV
ncbi:MAG: ABC transporter ATP-binding protein [Rubrobacteraceae bacterium]